jgi:hypothetical protein
MWCNFLLWFLISFSEGKLYSLFKLLNIKTGRAITQAVSRWLPTAAARVRAPGLVMLRIVVHNLAMDRFSPSTSVSPANHEIAPQSPSSIIWGWYNRPVVAAVPSGTQSHPTKKKKNHKQRLTVWIYIRLKPFTCFERDISTRNTNYVYFRSLGLIISAKSRISMPSHNTSACLYFSALKTVSNTESISKSHVSVINVAADWVKAKNKYNENSDLFMLSSNWVKKCQISINSIQRIIWIILSYRQLL